MVQELISGNNWHELILNVVISYLKKKNELIRGFNYWIHSDIIHCKMQSTPLNVTTSKLPSHASNVES